MNEIERRQLLNEVVENLKDKGYDYKPFKVTIDIYLDMKQQESVILERINTYEGTEEGNNLLLEALQQLREDIGYYKKALLID